MKLVFFVEGQSDKVFVEGIFSRLTTDKPFVYPLGGKSEMKKQLPIKLKGWKKDDDVKFVILRDQDSGNCIEIKKELKLICENSGKQNVIVRIACHELESWYLGDLLAVEKGLGITNLSKRQNNSKYKSPDNLNNAKEELMKITNNRYQEISGSREIAKYISLDETNKSYSFKVFLSGMKNIAITDIGMGKIK